MIASTGPLANRAIDVVHVSAHHVYWPLLSRACSSRGSDESEQTITAALRAEYNVSLAQLVRRLSPERGWLLVEWLSPGDVAVQSYANLHRCGSVLHQRLEAIGYSQQGFETRLRAYGAIVAQPMPATSNHSQLRQLNPFLWHDWGYHSFRARVIDPHVHRGYDVYSSRGLFVVCVRGCGGALNSTLKRTRREN